MIVFQVKGQSNIISTLKGKEKDVIKNFYIYHQVHRRHRGARKTAKPSKIKARSSRPCTNCSLYRCAYDVHNYNAQQHRAGQIISPLTLQTITTAQMLSVGGEDCNTEERCLFRCQSLVMVRIQWSAFREGVSWTIMINSHRLEPKLLFRQMSNLRFTFSTTR